MTGRLTFPAYAPGAADILTGGRSIGFCLDEGGGSYGYAKRWRAYLYPAAQERRLSRPADCEEVTARTLADLRDALRGRIEIRGQWWT